MSVYREVKAYLEKRISEIGRDDVEGEAQTFSSEDVRQELKRVLEVAQKAQPWEFGCKAHNGEHPFFWKESVGGYVTFCHEVYKKVDQYPRRRE